MKKTAKALLLSLSLAFLPLFLLASPDSFYLKEAKSSAAWGPFPIRSGTSVQLAGKTYQLRIIGRDRLAFLAPDREIFGPLQMVEGRLVRIDGAMYAFYLQGTVKRVPKPLPPVEKPVAEPFIPAPPPLPEPIQATKETPHRVVVAKDLPALPRPSSRMAISAWFAPIDNTPVDWKIDSLDAADSTVKRKSMGADWSWGPLSAQLSYSFSMESGDLVPRGVGILGSALDDGSGMSLQVGYSRPFLREGGWTAKAGVRGVIRHDKADLSTRSLTGGSVDTNGYVSADYVTTTTSLTLNEYSIWLNLGLEYAQETWGLHADFSVQPVSEFKVDGDFVYGGKGYSIDCDRDTPIAFAVGAWYDYQAIRFFSDVSFGADELFRLGVSYRF